MHSVYIHGGAAVSREQDAFAVVLAAEIERTKALIQRMDFPPNCEMWGNGIMSQLRAEKLDLLESLQRFYPPPSTASGAGAEHQP
jgi:hypothetical protein